MRRQGTGTVEVKSGYGLDIATEARLLRLAREVTDEVTFLGAHVVPPDSDEGVEGIAALRERYAQYGEQPPPGPVLLITVHRWSGWAAQPV